MRWLLAFCLAILPATTIAQNLCSGLVTDKTQRSQPSMSKPPVGVWQTDTSLPGGVRFMRLTDTASEGWRAWLEDPVVKPAYSPIQAWNADESYLLLVDPNRGFRLFNGRTYAFIKNIGWPLSESAAFETVFWHPTDPDLILYPSYDRNIRQYRVSTDTAITLKNFDAICGSDFLFADSHLGLSPSMRIGLSCGTDRFVYDINDDLTFGPVTDTYWGK